MINHPAYGKIDTHSYSLQVLTLGNNKLSAPCRPSKDGEVRRRGSVRFNKGVNDRGVRNPYQCLATFNHSAHNFPLTMWYLHASGTKTSTWCSTTSDAGRQTFLLYSWHVGSAKQEMAKGNSCVVTFNVQTDVTCKCSMTIKRRFTLYNTKRRIDLLHLYAHRLTKWARPPALLLSKQGSN